MNKIDININQAELSSIYITFLPDGVTNVAATLSLFSGSIKVSDYRISTESWQVESNKFAFPVELISPLQQIQAALEKIATQKCNAALKQIPATLSSDEDDLPF